jgi:hypothetical protein
MRPDPVTLLTAGVSMMSVDEWQDSAECESSQSDDERSAPAKSGGKPLQVRLRKANKANVCSTPQTALVMQYLLASWPLKPDPALATDASTNLSDGHARYHNLSMLSVVML